MLVEEFWRTLLVTARTWQEAMEVMHMYKLHLDPAMGRKLLLYVISVAAFWDVTWVTSLLAWGQLHHSSGFYLEPGREEGANLLH